MGQTGLNLYCVCKPVVDTEYSSESDDSLVEVIVEALAEAEGVDSLDFPPLYEFVDPDALDYLIRERAGESQAETFIGFQVETWNVFVRADGRVCVCDSTQAIDPEPVFESAPA